MIDEELSKCKTLAELLKISHDLKVKGFDVIEVNNALVKYKKQLKSRKADVKNIEKIFLTDVPKDKFSTINVVFNDIRKPVIKIEGNTFLI